jgi:hypothetical protein
MPHTQPLPTKSEGRTELKQKDGVYVLTQTEFKNEIKGTFEAIDELEAYVNDQTKTTPRLDGILKELSESGIFLYEEELS